MATDHINAFPGPRAFSLHESGHFYGRRREISDIYNLSGAYRDLLVYGGSGVGKSSVVVAGVVPKLLKSGARVIQARITRTGRVHVPGLSALHVLLQYDSQQPDDILNQGAQASDGGTERVVWPVEGDAGPGTLGALVSDASGTKTFVVFDECESLFLDDQHSSAEQRSQFFEALRSLFSEFSQFRSIFVVTEEYVCAMQRFAEFVPNGFNIRYGIERLTKVAALEAIEAGLHDAGVSIQANVGEAIVERLAVGGGLQGSDATSAEIEPLHLQLVCRALLRRLHPNEELSLAGVDAFGGIDNVLGTFYDGLITDAKQKWGTPEEKVRKWFEDDLVTPELARGLIHSRSAPARSVSDEAIRYFTTSHLIRSVEVNQSVWYELTHDRLIVPIKAANKVYFERRARRRRFVVTLTVVTFLAVVLWALQVAVTRLRSSESRKRPNAIIVEKASEAFDQRKFQIAALWADYGIENYRTEADRIEKELERDHVPEPPTGAVADEMRVAILRRGVLNDAAFCYYIRGRASEELGDRQMALRFYRAARLYSYGRSLDLHGWFWSPAEEAARRLSVLH